MGILAAISVPKKLLLAAFMLFFGAFILGLSLQSTNAGNSSFTSQSSQQPMAKLVFREMVPGNPFYALLMIKDRIVLELTFDPIQNAWLRVEYATQRLETAKALIDRDEIPLAVSTLAKAEIYIGKAADLLNTHDSAQLKQLQPILLEHRHQLQAAKTLIDGSDGARVEELLNYNASLIQTISQH